MGIPQGGVAFFDSGIGGLTVLAACRKVLPDTVFYYYGDNRHAPYGNLSPNKIRRYVLRAFRKFKRKKVAAAVVACNTATAVCIEELRRRYAFPILGTEPAVGVAAKRGGEAWVLSTRATYESARFQQLCQRARQQFPAANVTAYPCDALAGEIEKNLGGGEMDLSALLPRGSPTGVVLGCTHYPYVREKIEAFYGCKTFDGNEGIARRLKEVLQGKKGGEKPLKNPLDHPRPPSVDFRPERTAPSPPSRFDGRKILLRQNINKRSFFTKRQKAEGLKTKGEEKIFFLGGAKKRNRNVYKQMFV